MAAENIILDASALIASIYEEKGAEVVDRHLEHAVISTVNLAEVASYMVRDGAPLAEVRGCLDDLALGVAEFSDEQAYFVAGLLPKTAPKGLSLGDRACLALALVLKLPVLTADKSWKTLAVDVKIELIR